MSLAVGRVKRRLSRDGLRLSVLLVWGLAWARPLPVSVGDHVVLPALSDPADAILVVRGGTDQATCVADRLRKGKATLEIGSVVPKLSCQKSDVVLFAKGTRMSVKPVVWTTGADAVTLPAPGSRVVIDFSLVLVAKGPAAAQQVGRDTLQAIARFNENRTGLTFRSSRILLPKHLTKPDIAAIGSRCDKEALTSLATKTKLYDPKRINVYFVPGLPGWRGLNCYLEGYPNVIYISAAGDSPTTLAHELGHALGLQDWYPRMLGHTGALSTSSINGFTYLNIMWTGLYDPEAFAQRHLSIGQGYRMNMDKSSWVITQGLVPGRTPESCHPLAAKDSLPCPMLALDTVPTP